MNVGDQVIVRLEILPTSDGNHWHLQHDRFINGKVLRVGEKIIVVELEQRSDLRTYNPNWFGVTPDRIYKPR